MYEQIHTFENGGFVVHRIYISGSACKFSAWFDAEGNMLDAARYDAKHRELAATSRQRDEIARLRHVYRAAAQRTAVS